MVTMNWIILVGLAAISTSGVGLVLPGFVTKKPVVIETPCDYKRSYGMAGFVCARNNVEYVPTELRTEILWLDLSYNRIRDIYNETFNNYAYLVYLYLGDNSISCIEAGAFEPLQELKILDLSKNSLHSVPDALYSPPLLGKLHLGQNPFKTVIFTKPMPSVEILTIDNSRLTELPALEMFPRLKSLNVSINRINKIDITNISPLCRLVELDLRYNKNLFKENCDCFVFSNWTTLRGIKVYPRVEETCVKLSKGADLDASSCYNNETQALYEENQQAIRSCESQVMEYGSGPVRLRGSVLWTLGIAVAVLVLLICASSVYCAKRRRRPQNYHADRLSSGIKGRS